MATTSDERIYDPAFAKRAEPNHAGECQFVRFHRYLEGCSLPGCRVGRVSREWIESMKRAVSAGVNDGE